MSFNQEFIIFSIICGDQPLWFFLVLNLTLTRVTRCPVYLYWKGWEISALLFFTAQNFFLLAGNPCSVLALAHPRNIVTMLPSSPSLPFGDRREYTPFTSVSQSIWRAPEQIQLGPGHLLLLVLSFCHMFTSPLLHPLFRSPSVNPAAGERLPVFSTKKRGRGSSTGTASRYLMIIADSLRYFTMIYFF